MKKKMAISVICWLVCFAIVFYCDLFLFYEPIASGFIGVLAFMIFVVSLLVKTERRYLIKQGFIGILVVTTTIFSGYIANNYVDKAAQKIIGKIRLYESSTGRYPESLIDMMDGFEQGTEKFKFGARCSYGITNGKPIFMYQYFPIDWKVYDFKSKKLSLMTG